MADDADRASELEEARIQKSLMAITKVITDLTADHDCIDCGNEIEPERLKVLPSAKRCYICQEVYERPRRVKRF